MPAKANIDPYSDPVVETILKEFRRGETLFKAPWSVEKFGKAVVRRTFGMAFYKWGDSARDLAALALAMLRLQLFHTAYGREDMEEMYKEFFNDCKEYELAKLVGDERAYFFRQIE